jgi:hypothetical protein
MKISQDVRDFATAQGIAEQRHWQKWMELKSVVLCSRRGRFITKRELRYGKVEALFAPINL